MSEPLFLGIDTSNYTTSVAVADAAGRVLFNERQLLSVKEGERGLRQADAVFSHIKNLPELSEKLRAFLGGHRPAAVGVSVRPRNKDGSYMPCFLSGVAAAQTAAATLGVPLFSFSHQCGHLRAAVYSAGAESLFHAPFGAFHISGGTTEMLYAKYENNGFSVDIVGGTKDLSAGQLIDRIGVKLGLSFPCGAALEKLAAGFTGRLPRVRVRAEDGFIHLSGMENKLEAMYAETGDKAFCAAFLLSYLAEAIVAMSLALRDRYGDSLPIVYAGGVMSDSIIREKVEGRIADAFFAAPAFATDNAAGTALLTKDAFLAQNTR